MVRSQVDSSERGSVTPGWRILQDRKLLAAKMLQHGWRAYHSQRAKMDQSQRQKYKDSESGVPENSILNEPLFYKAALHYAQMRAESVDGALLRPCDASVSALRSKHGATVRLSE